MASFSPRGYGPAGETQVINETCGYITITFSRRCKSFGRIDTELASQANQYEQYWKSLLQRLVSVIKFIADRGLLRQLALDASRGGASPQKIRETRA